MFLLKKCYIIDFYKFVIYGIYIEFVTLFKVVFMNTDILKVLVIDDNLFNRKLACAILKDHKLDYDIAENGKIAIDFYKKDHYDLILMDIQMPIMNGIDCAKSIRELEKNNGSYTPIIAVTAFANELDKRNCLEAGMDAFVAKPYNAPNLVKVMAKYINITSVY